MRLIIFPKLASLTLLFLSLFTLRILTVLICGRPPKCPSKLCREILSLIILVEKQLGFCYGSPVEISGARSACVSDPACFSFFFFSRLLSPLTPKHSNASYCSPCFEWVLGPRKTVRASGLGRFNSASVMWVGRRLQMMSAALLLDAESKKEVGMKHLWSKWWPVDGLGAYFRR